MPQSSRVPIERVENQVEPLATTEDVARHCRASKRTVQAWYYHKIIPCIKIGRLVRFRLRDVEKALNRHTIQEVK
jgi:excisionase family DNA binding protein